MHRRRRILLVRVDGIGDALAMAPLVAALRDAGHVLSAVLSTRNADAFAPGTFERVYVLERIPWPRHGSTPVSYALAVAEARASNYDAALILSEEPEAYRFARDIYARRRIGFVNGFEKPLKTVWARVHLDRAVLRSASGEREHEHEAQTLFRLGTGLHGEARPTRDPTRLRPLVVADVRPHGRVAVQLTAKLRDLGIDDDALAAALAALARTVPCVAVADVREAGDMRDLAERAGMELEQCASVERWKALLAGARAVVAPDSGAAHVAGMTGVGCVDLFPASAARDLGRWYPWAAPSWTIAVTPRVAGRFAEQLLAGVDYCSLRPQSVAPA